MLDEYKYIPKGEVIPNNLRKIRLDQSLTFAQLSRLSGVPYTTIFGYEDIPPRIPSILNAYKLSNALGVPVEDIWENPFN